MSTRGTALSINLVMTSAIKGATFLQASVKSVHKYAKPLQTINFFKSTKFPLLKKNLHSLENHLGKIRSQSAKITANPIRLDISTSKNSLKEARKDMTAIASDARMARNYTKLSANDLQRGASTARKQSRIGKGAKYATATVGATTVGAIATLNPIRKSIIFESAMADVKKATNADDKKIKELKQNILKIVKGDKGSLLTPSQIAMIQAGGGRSGVKTENLPSFTKDIAMASIAMDLPVEEVGKDFAKMAEKMDIPIKKISILTNSFTHLENNSANLGRDLIDTTGRLSGVFRGLKFEPQNAAAISSFMNTLEVSPELAASSFKMLMDRFKKTDDKLGYYKKLQKNGAFALKGIIKDINSSMTTKEQIKMFDSSGENIISNMTTKLNALDKSLATVAEKKMLTAVASEYSIRMATTEAREIASKNKITVESILVGDKLKGTYISLVEAVPKAIAKTVEFYHENKQMIHTIAEVVLKLGAVAIAIKAISFISSPFVSLAKTAFKYRNQIASIARFGYSFLKTTAVVAYRIALVAMRVTATIAKTAIFLMAGALKMAGRAILFIGRALLLNPIGLAVTAIATGAYLIYNNWAMIKTFFTEMWITIKAKFNSGVEFIKTSFSFSPLGMIIKSWKPISTYFTTLVQAIKFPFIGFFSWIENKFKSIGLMVAKAKAFITGEEIKKVEVVKPFSPVNLTNKANFNNEKIDPKDFGGYLNYNSKDLKGVEIAKVFSEPNYYTPPKTFESVNLKHEKTFSDSSSNNSKSVHVGIDNINVKIETTDGKFDSDDFVEQVDKAMREIAWENKNTTLQDAS